MREGERAEMGTGVRRRMGGGQRRRGDEANLHHVMDRLE